MTPFLNHVGLTVTDLETSVAFYTEIAGMEVVRRSSKPTGGAFFDELTGTNGARIMVVVVARGGFALQLVQYLAEHGSPAGVSHNRAGTIHICLNVEGLDELHASIVATGRHSPTQIVQQPIPDVRSFYVRDPDGVPVEFIEGPYVVETTGVPESRST